MAKIIRLTEGDIHNMIHEALQNVLKEANGDWKAAYDKFNSEGGDFNDYLNLARNEFGGDEKARIKALNKHIADKDAKRELRMNPEEIAREKTWERKYNREHGIGDDDSDLDFDDFEAEKEKQWKKRAGHNAPKRASKINQDIPTRSPEEIERQMRELGYIK